MAQRDWRQWGSSKPATAGQRGVSVLNRWQHENCVSFESLLTLAALAADGVQVAPYAQAAKALAALPAETLSAA